MNTQTHTPSTWASKFRAIGPGLMMATAAVGGSHIIMSTQAGALYGWQLAMIIILANVFKYPFFRFGPQYTLETGKSLIQGYAEKSPVYLCVFLLLNLFATVINTAAVAMVCAAILNFVLPVKLDINVLAGMVLGSSVLMLLVGPYRLLDRMSKIIMISLTFATVVAVAIAASRGSVAPSDYISPSAWDLAALGFIVSLMGWMPAPIEISAINSLWVAAKKQLNPVSYEDGIFDFNVGYVVTAILALVFLSLGALVQHGSGVEVKMAGAAYIGQLIDMYAKTIGEWSRWLVAFIAFACMYGTTLTVVDGYSRSNMEAMRLLTKQKKSNNRILAVWIVLAAISGMGVIIFFKGAVLKMMAFATVASFVSAPIFAWLNLSLIRKGSTRPLSAGLLYLSFVGLIFLTGFTLLFLADKFGLLK
ncbi:NRAMP family divalent metal transporter [Wielerella bovis]|uniref:NRAMP family divalent metal transporter n=1 Tax=Wielerella bovis TaxID=2917790 RepID=UPI0020195487|nr:NRAMP family divalent metal transporter [Wielerella bovis]MCG7656714.1 divalent metal cation transporter [Wielerella bovis]MCG7658937.1 divalent metal cation transporter [Wielerella bovis]